MKKIIADKNLVAYCGLYCGSCKKYLNEKCPGCKNNEKAAWCKIRVCCIENKYSSCADCKEFKNVSECKKFNNLISKIFGVIFRSDRKACVDKIRKIGYESYSKEMATKKTHTIKKS